MPIKQIIFSKKLIIVCIPLFSIINLLFFKDAGLFRNFIFLAQFFLFVLIISKVPCYKFNVIEIFIGVLIFGGTSLYFINAYYSSQVTHWFDIYSIYLAYFYLLYIKNNSKDAIKGLMLVYLISCIYIIILNSYRHYFGLPIIGQNLFTMITIPLLFLIVLIAFKYNSVKYSMLLNLSSIGLLVALLSIGRSGILSSFLLFAVTILYFILGNEKLNSTSWTVKKISFILFYIFLFISLVLYLNNYFNLLNHFMVNQFNDIGRFTVLSEFQLELTFANIIIGDYEGVLRNSPMVYELGGNFHNTYLDMVSKFGFFSFLIFASIILKILRLNPLFFLASISVLLRFGTDTGNDLFTYIGIFSILILADSKVKRHAGQSSKVRPCTTPHPNANNSFSLKNA